MKNLLFPVLAALTLGASAAQGSGIDLSWNDCAASGAATVGFACNTNTGPPLALIASFVPPAGVDSLVGLLAQVDVTAGTTLPDWWRVGAGECRLGALSTTFDFTTNTNCVDPWLGQALGGFTWDSGFRSVNRGRLMIECAISDNLKGPVDPAQEYYAFRVNITRIKTIGGGSCAGCEFEACIVLNSLHLFQSLQQGFDPEIDVAETRNFVTWQSVSILDCPQGTPVRNATWGAVKSLYR